MQPKTTEYRALCRIDRDDKTYRTGSLVALPADTAERLLAMDPPAIERVEAPEPAKANAAERLNAKATIEKVKAATSIEQLLQIQEEEQANGARPTVLAAIDARLEALTKGDGADDEEDDEEESAS
ncbi:MAG: hypothetical protein KF709_02640 [Gemmatimonadaceae bacterium]|nr:hypothetical protein [Gemmatimonadaceae bacterium]